MAILPDGLFTPGTHVEYFFRREDLSGPNTGKVDIEPDTTTVYPQNDESSFDGHRWQEFSVLPDAWKANRYSGGADPCMLYVDWNDRRGDEVVWTSVADSIGATSVAMRGNNNGWAAPGGPGTYQVPGPGVVGSGHVNDPAYFVNKNSSAGTTWDKYDIKCAESTSNGGSSLGSRLSNRTHAGGDLLVQGGVSKDARNAPTPDMLNAFYKIILLLSGDLNTHILGPFTDRSADDAGILSAYLLSSSSGGGPPHGVLAGGNGFAEDAFNAGPPQEDLTSLKFGGNISAASAGVGYLTLSGYKGDVTDLEPQYAGLGAGTYTWGVRNVCYYTLDMLDVTTAQAQEGTRYHDYGTSANGPYISSVVHKAGGGEPWFSDLEGWDIFVMTSRFDINTTGRLQYYTKVFSDVFGYCNALGTGPIIPLDTPNTGNGGAFVDFVGNFTNNPLRSGTATVKFGLAHSDRVEVDIYDVAGRLQRKLADRMFPAGNWTLTWDGVNDQGHLVPRGVYFTQVKYVNRHFSDSKKLTVLK